MRQRKISTYEGLFHLFQTCSRSGQALLICLSDRYRHGRELDFHLRNLSASAMERTSHDRCLLATLCLV